MKHYRVLPLLLALALLLTLSPALAADNTRTGPPGEDALPTLLDTGRGYIAYYFYASAIYWSPDGVTWTDLSDRSWVQEARGYIGRALGHREFQVIWTGTEYMLRQDLRDDARSAYQTIGDSPRNSTVTFLDEDFQIIGELPLGGAVTDIRYEDDTYYATVDGNEVAFTREEWLPKDLTTEFSDVPADAWYAPYVEVCVEAGLMTGVGEGRFAPEKTLSWQECAMLALRLHHMGQGGNGVFDPAPAEWNYYTLRTQADDTLVSQGYLDRDGQGMDLHWIYLGSHIVSPLGFDLETEDDMAWGQEMNRQPVTLTVNGVAYSGTFDLYDQHLFFSLNEDEYTNHNYNIPFQDSTTLWVGDTWYRDGWYYAQQNELGWGRLVFSSDARWAFASRMAEVTDLPAINDISANAIPDLEPQLGPADTLELYRAGVLTGVDDRGTFAPWSTMTRAEAAAICARILKPELRVRFTLPTEGYTLTVLGDEPTGTVWQGGRSVGDGLAVFYTDEGQGPIWTLYTKAGHRLTLEDRPYHWDDGLLVLDRGQADQRFGVMDLKSLEMVVPFGPYEHCMIQEDGFHQSGFYILTDDPSTDLPSYLAWDREGRNIATMDYATMEWRRGFANGLHRQKPSEDGLYGYVDPSYQFVIPPQWADAASFQDGYAAVAVAGDSGLVWGVIDTQGNQVVPPRYEYLENRGQGVFLTGDNAGSLYGLLFAGTEGQPQLPLAQTNCVLSFPFQNGYGVYELGDGAGAYYMDLTGQQASQVFDWAGPVDADGSALVGLNGYIYRLDFRR